jgi:hypothetical protein
MAKTMLVDSHRFDVQLTQVGTPEQVILIGVHQ